MRFGILLADEWFAANIFGGRYMGPLKLMRALESTTEVEIEMLNRVSK
jgi:hypothetical protein